MSFFTAVVADDGNTWRAKDVDVEDCSSLDDLADLMREVAHGGRPVLCVIEREDGWFAFVRVDDDEPATLFVSDLPAVLEGHYADLLGSAADLDAAVPPGVHAYERAADDEGEDEDGRTEAERERDAEAENQLSEALGGALIAPDPDPEPVDNWAGDPTLLADRGVSASRLVELANENPDDPATALAEIGELAGFGELVEALR